MPVKGFKDSKLSLNSWICEQEEWNLEKLESRFDLLYQVDYYDLENAKR